MTPLDLWFLVAHVPILIALGIEDLQEHRIRDDFVKLLLCIGLTYIVFNGILNGGMVAAADGAMKFCLAGLILIPLTITYWLKQMGFGDVKLLGVLAFSLPGFNLAVLTFMALTALLSCIGLLKAVLGGKETRMKYWLPIGSLVLPALCLALAVAALG